MALYGHQEACAEVGEQQQHGPGDARRVEEGEENGTEDAL